MIKRTSVLGVDFVGLINIAKQQNKTVDKEYRLYYNKDTGEPIEYSMEKLSGDYITVTKEQYAAGRHDVLVKNKALVSIEDVRYIRKLIPGSSGTACHESNVLLVDKESTTRWKIKGVYISND
tara:strand:+ start:41549 stop:41917 length:369 start_codon:yes stop_codon:yes gene_type:complete